MNIRRPKKAAPRDRRFTDKEIKLLIYGNKTSEKLKSIIQIALETGMRVGEILGIKKEHINGQTLYIPVTKTKPRSIPLTKRALEILNNTNLPFTLSAMAVSKQFNWLCKFYKIHDGRFHDLRRQALTNFMIEKKLSVAEVMLISGHADPRILLNIYNNTKIHDLIKKL